MKIKRIMVFLLIVFFLLPSMAVVSFAAENIGIAVKNSSETVETGGQVTVTISLTDYDIDAVPILGIQIDVTDVDESILTVEEGGYVSLIDDEAVMNTAVYLPEDECIRLIYVQITDTLPQPYDDVFQMTFMVNSELTEAGSITLPLTAKIQTTESRLTLHDEITISYVPSSEVPNPEDSVEITWGAMEFTYSDGTWNPATHSYEGGGWTDNGTGYVTVKNTSDTDLETGFTYTTERSDIRGEFSDGDQTVTAPVSLAAGEEKTVYLILEGKPSDYIGEQVPIGTVNVVLGGK